MNITKLSMIAFAMTSLIAMSDDISVSGKELLSALDDATASQVEEGTTAPLTKKSSSFYDIFIKDRLTVGAAYSTHKLTNGRREFDEQRIHNFVGALNVLEETEKTQTQPVVSYRIHDFLLLSASRGEYEYQTHNATDDLGDGIATLSGPVFTAELTYPLLSKRIFPHVGFGYSPIKTDFIEDSWWGFGYTSPKNWEYYGGEYKRNPKGNERYIDIDDVKAKIFTCGVAVRPIRNLQIDFSYQEFEADPACSFGYIYKNGFKGKELDGDFNFAHKAYLVSLSFVF